MSENSVALNGDGEAINRWSPVFLSSRTEGAEYAAGAAAIRARGAQIGHCDPTDHAMSTQLRKGWLGAWAGPVVMTPEVLHRLPRSRVILRHAYVVVNDKVGARLRREARDRGVVQFVSLPLLNDQDATARLVDVLSATGPSVEEVATKALDAMVPRTHGQELTDEEREAVEHDGDQ